MVPTVGATDTDVRYNVALLKEDMALRGWLPTHLARAAGVSEMTVSRFLSGKVQTAPTLKKFAEALGRAPRRYIVPTEVQAAS